MDISDYVNLETRRELSPRESPVDTFLLRTVPTTCTPKAVIFLALSLNPAAAAIPDKSKNLFSSTVSPEIV